MRRNREIRHAEIHERLGRAVLFVTFDDGDVDELFAWFTDEHSFRASEFIGLTEPEARSKYHEADVAYLQS